MVTPIRFEKRFYLGTSECDINGVLKLASVLDMAQNTADEHGMLLNKWHSHMTEKNLAWVLVKTDMYVDRYQHLGETVLVRSFTKGSRTMFCLRYFLLMDERGENVVRIGSLFMLMDRTTRKAVPPAQRGIVIPDEEETEVPVKISMRVRNVAGEEKNTRYLPQYADVDVNGHVNNTRYADWLCNSMGIEKMKQSEIAFVSVDYHHEMLPNMLLENSLILEEDEFQFSGNVDGVRYFNIYGRLRPRTVHE